MGSRLTPTRGQIALHEAAHGVVFAQLRVPFVRVSIGEETVQQLVRNRDTGIYELTTLYLHGGCLARPEAYPHQVAALPDSNASAALQRYAVCIAAGPAADRALGLDDVGGTKDRDDLNEVGFLLGIGPTARSLFPLRFVGEDLVIPRVEFDRAIAEPEMHVWVEDRISAADRVLLVDGGNTWRQVAARLEAEGVLSSDAVIHLVETHRL